LDTPKSRDRNREANGLQKQSTSVFTEKLTNSGIRAFMEDFSEQRDKLRKFLTFKEKEFKKEVGLSIRRQVSPRREGHTVDTKELFGESMDDELEMTPSYSRHEEGRFKNHYPRGNKLRPIIRRGVDKQ
jgi:hypothetical protein